MNLQRVSSMLDVLANLGDALYLALVLASEERRPCVLLLHHWHFWRERCSCLQRRWEHILASLADVRCSHRWHLVQLGLVEFVF